ncbi:glucose-1-phosphate thymidylyltransferase [Spirosoma taeanense]|uniref:Glucose-1-phosphate thymidylyltransferase n=1 Tax=Spirosoma taeanense TaxID=2735870 RepID=A0A6M5Y4P2_9BACT|nr:putative sugar nucleotidyl transferase [Spirosoma taeanense]QJW88376.1 glucose-1-phosphate thymidylyltransferase [Spirosoma taeanense]
MSNLILFDDPAIRPALLPFTFTRPVADIRVGILTITEKWTLKLRTEPSFLAESYLRVKYPLQLTTDNLFINGAVCPTDELVDRIKTLSLGESLISPGGLLLALRTDRNPTEADQLLDIPQHTTTFDEPVPTLRQLWSIIAAHGNQLRADFTLITAGRQSQPITDPFTRCYAPENIFLEEGATVRASILNAEDGPIYIGRNASISEGSVVIGPFALGEGSMVHYNSKMRKNTSVGPYCKIGGEVANSILFANSNKGHEGYLGDSVVGEWCNLGAGTNTSNLKNDYSTVKLHSYVTNDLVDTGRMFCGLIMGDYTRTGIGTMFNTGTVVGVNVNVFGSGLPPKHVPSFSWGGAQDGFSLYRIEKALRVADEAFKRRERLFDMVEEDILRAVFNAEQANRSL